MLIHLKAKLAFAAAAGLAASALAASWLSSPAEKAGAQAAQGFTFIRPAKGLPEMGKLESRFGGDCLLTHTAEEPALGAAEDRGECASFRQAKFRISVERFDGPLGPLPLQIYQPEQAGSLRRILVRIVGGPADGIGVAVNDWLGRLLGDAAAAGTATVTLGYVGTSSRLVEGRDTIDLAAQEVAAYVAYLERRYPNIPKMILAESFGGYVAARAADRLRGIPIVLAAPLLQRPGALLDSFEGPEWERMRNVNARRVTLADIRDGVVVRREERMINNFQMMRAMFADHLDRSATEYLTQAGHDCLTLVYGTADPKIGVSEIPGMQRALPDMKVIPMPGLGHELTGPDQEGRMRAALEQAIAQATCPPGGSTNPVIPRAGIQPEPPRTLTPTPSFARKRESSGSLHPARALRTLDSRFSGNDKVLAELGTHRSLDLWFLLCSSVTMAVSLLPSNLLADAQRQRKLTASARTWPQLSQLPRLSRAGAIRSPQARESPLRPSGD